MLVLCLHYTGFSLVVVNSGSSVVAVQGLLTAVALLVLEQGSRAFVLASGVAACGLSSCCSGALEYRLMFIKTFFPSAVTLQRKLASLLCS